MLHIVININSYKTKPNLQTKIIYKIAKNVTPTKNINTKFANQFPVALAEAVFT